MTTNQFKSIQSTLFKHWKWLTASLFLDMPCNNITSQNIKSSDELAII